MTPTLSDILQQVSRGELPPAVAQAEIMRSHLGQLGHTHVDLMRQERTGANEVIYGAGKTPQQIVDIATLMLEHQQNVLVTRVADDAMQVMRDVFPDARIHAQARLVQVMRYPVPQARGIIAVVTAGTSDQAVAEEAALTAEFFGNPVERFYDCGVAGLHRLMAHIEQIRKAKVIIAVAGMEGALPSVLAGLVKIPLIAVPTSVGYGANLEGITTLLAMMNSCANGVSVVNINNGFGAAYNAHLINRLFRASQGF